MLANNFLLGAFAIAGLSAILLTLLLLAAVSHPMLTILLILVIAGVFSNGSNSKS